MLLLKKFTKTPAEFSTTASFPRSLQNDKCFIFVISQSQFWGPSMFICFSNDVFYVVAYKTVCFLSLAEVKKIFSANAAIKKCSSTDI